MTLSVKEVDVRRLLRHLVFIGFSSCLAASCVSPQSLRVPAQHNQENIQAYNQNVAALVRAIRAQVQTLGELQVQIARNQTATLLVDLRRKSNAASLPALSVLTDPTQEPHATLKVDVDAAAGKQKQTSVQRELIERQFPLVANIVLEPASADIPSVITDAFAVVKVNTEIANATDPAITALLFQQRNRILDQYPVPRRERETVNAVIEAMDSILLEILNQGQLASDHAQVFIQFSEAKPKLSTMEAFTDKELQAAVLERVRKSKGDEAAEQVKGYFTRANSAFEGILSSKK